MATRIFYLPLEKDFKDSAGNTWTPTGSYEFVKLSDDNDGEINALYLKSKTSRLTGNFTKKVNSTNFVIKFYLQFLSNTNTNDCFDTTNYTSYNGFRLVQVNGNLYIEFGQSPQYIFSWTPTIKKWYFFEIVKSGSTLNVYINNTLAKSFSCSATQSVTFSNVIGSCAQALNTMIGYYSNISLWEDTNDRTLDYTYESKKLEFSIKAPSNITGTYTTAPNKIKYFYKVTFNKSSNVVNYVTEHKRRQPWAA